MKRKMLIIMMVSIVAGMAFSQGALNPSSSPSATMKTLTEIDSSITGIDNTIANLETRIDIETVSGNSTYLHVIQEGGSYYLSKNIELTNWANGIYVNAQGVTIDLNGFEISRSLTGEHGIYGTSNSYNLRVRNGFIRNFQYGINAYGSHSSFENIAFSECTSYGLYVYNPSYIIDCMAYNNYGGGFYLANAGTMKGCIATENQAAYGIYAAAGSVLSDCVTTDNAGYGIYVGADSVLTCCTSKGNTSSGFYAQSGSTLQQCISRMNVMGFNLGNGCILDDCIAMDNQSTGFYCIGKEYQLHGCISRGNSGSGFFIGDDSILENCSAFVNNGSSGITAGDRAIVQRCISSLNEFNSYSSSTAGIRVGDSSAVRNSMTWGNTTTYSGSSQGAGIITGTDATVNDCSSIENKGDGIQVDGNSQVIGNLSYNNSLYTGTYSGINVLQSGCRIEGNQVLHNGYGITALFDDTVIIKNIASDNSAKSYNFSSGQQFKGATLTNLTGITTLDSWANFEF